MRSERPGGDDSDAASGSEATPARRPAGRTGLGSVALVGLCVLFTLVLRLPYLTWPLLPDEAGLLIIAEQWREGPFLYGDYFVGRGVLLVLLYSLADALGGVLALRLLACVVAASMVVAAGWAGYELRGRPGAGWAALVAASYSSSYAWSSGVMNGRLVAAAVVMLSCACTLAAIRRVGTRAGDALAVLAGVAAAAALLFVQSYVEGAAFAGVLLLASWRLRILPGAAAARIASRGALGMLLTAAALSLGILVSWATASQLWFQMFGFRWQVRATIDSSDSDMERLVTLLVIAALSGALLLLLCLVLNVGQVVRRRDVAAPWMAVSTMAVVSGVVMTLGGSWYADYLLQMIPALVLATALVAPQRTWTGLGMRLGAVIAALAAVVAQYLGLERPILGTTTTEAAVGRWVAAGVEEGDTAVVTWGKANLLHEAGTTSPYPYLWSLLTRTLDPDLELLLATLRGPDAPTWVVEWYDFESWGGGGGDDLAEVIGERYVHAGSPCGVDVYVLETEPREPPPDDLCGTIRDG